MLKVTINFNTNMYKGINKSSIPYIIFFISFESECVDVGLI